MSLLNQIKEYDNVLTEEEFSEVEKHLSSFGWGKHYSIATQKDKFLWVLPGLEKLDFFSVTLLNKIQKITKMKFNVERIYANAQTTLLDGYPHFDTPDDNAYTFLIYMNRQWQFEWGGETLFLDRYYDVKKKDAVEVSKNYKLYLPKPNCALFFPGKIYHFGKSPSKDFCDIRYTLAFKLFKK